MVDKTGQTVDVHFDTQWYGPEKSRLEYWRWAKSSASLTIINPHNFSVLAHVSFHLRSNDPREVIIKSQAHEIWRGSLTPREPREVVIKDFVLKSGDTLWQFETGKAVNQDSPTEPHPITFSLRNLKLELRDAGKDKP